MSLDTVRNEADGATAINVKRMVFSNYGGRISFRRVALLTVGLTALFGAVFVSDRLRGGYQAERLIR